MTTHTYTSPINHTTDAGFRAWGLALSGAFTSAGLTQTADTGQINWVTVVRAGINANAGYEIFRFNDTNQATAPVFIRVDYGTNAAVDRPRVLVTIGTGTNGAGTITGTVIPAATIHFNITAASTAVSYATRSCAVDGYFGLMWGLGATSTGSLGFGFLSIARSVDSTGAATAEAIEVYSGANAAGTLSACQVLRYATSDVITMVVGSQCLVHGGVTSSLVGGSAQVYKHYMNIPRVRPHPWILTVIAAEIGNNTQFQATAVGATARNYVSSGSQGYLNAGVALPASAAYAIAMLWE